MTNFEAVTNDGTALPLAGLGDERVDTATRPNETRATHNPTLRRIDDLLELIELGLASDESNLTDTFWWSHFGTRIVKTPAPLAYVPPRYVSPSYVPLISTAFPTEWVAGLQVAVPRYQILRADRSLSSAEVLYYQATHHLLLPTTETVEITESVPVSVPEEWITELRSIRNVERPELFEGYYEQE
jgi:hypothetical protein